MTTPALDLFDDAGLSAPAAQALRRIAIAGFHALWSGDPVTLDDLVGGDAAALTEAADRLQAGGRIELSDDGHVLAVHGLARRPTRHRIEHDDGVINTWCALDAIGIPAALAIDARAVTHCLTCGTEIDVNLTHGEPQALPGAVLWYPEARCGHLINDFCSGANLFCSVDHLEKWLGDNQSAGRMMTLDEVAELGRQAWREAAERFSPDV